MSEHSSTAAHAKDFACILGVLDAKSRHLRPLAQVLMRTADFVGEGLDSNAMQSAIDGYWAGRDSSNQTDHRRQLIEYVREIRETLPIDDERNDGRYWSQIVNTAQDILAEDIVAAFTGLGWRRQAGVLDVYDVWSNEHNDEESIFPLDRTKADYTYLLTRAGRVALNQH